MNMAEKRNITKADIFLEARLLSEGVQVKETAPPETPRAFPGTIVLDGCEISTAMRLNRYSRLEAEIVGNEIIISDMGEVLGTATFEERPVWYDIPLSTGQSAGKALLGMTPDLIAVITNNLCYNQQSGKGCRYCGLFRPRDPVESGDWGHASTARLQQRGAIAGEAIKIAIDNGWRGQISLSGGVLPPKKRGELTERFEILMQPLRDTVGEELLSSMQISANCYAPDDFSEMYKWRDIGVNSVQFDLEVMDSAYFAAICPNKNAAHPLEYWKEAQEAAVEIFGRWRGCSTSVVMGIEPMTSLVDGVEERLEQGVLTTPLCFMPSPGSAYEQFRPPTADWLVEANEKMAEAHFRLANTLDAPLLADDRPGYTRTGRSYPILMLTDEIWRRGQEMGQLQPGLPRQGGAGDW